MMDIRKINWQQTLDIRHRVLWPNKSKAFCIVEGDETANHYGIYIENSIIGVASTYRNANFVRLRKFAIELKYQKHGYGSHLLRRIIELEKAQGSGVFWCDARQSAIGFYQQFGLRVEGDIFQKSGEPYIKMCLDLK